MLELSFPQYKNSNKNTRFRSLFAELTRNKQISEMLEDKEISIEKINRGEDKRTSIVIQNVPMKMKKWEFLKIIEGLGNINFIYYPFNVELKMGYGFTVLNVINYKTIVNIFNKLNGYINVNDKNVIPFQVEYSEIQGRKELRTFFNRNNNENRVYFN